MHVPKDLSVLHRFVTIPDIKKELMPKSSSSVKSKEAAVINGDVVNEDANVDAKDSVTAAGAVEDVKRNISKQFKDTKIEDLDSLPDLIMEEVATKVQYEVITRDESCLLTDAEDRTGENRNAATPDEAKEGESGYISLPTSEEENSGDRIKKHTEDQIDLVSVQNDVTEHSVILSEDKPKQSVTDLGNTPNSDAVNKRRTFLTPKLANLLMENVTPTLSGGPDMLIDFDEEDPEKEKSTPGIPAGIEKLMERVIKHSAKRIPKKSEDVEIT
jgi:hypothetical protein